MSENDRMRRIPVQARSQQKVRVILDTAAQVFAEVGYGASTTNTIAKRAGVGIATLYRFFPNKAAILKTLSERYLTQIREQSEALFAASRIQTLSLQVVIEEVIDAFAYFCISEPGFEYLFYGSEARTYFSTVSFQIHREIVTQVENVLKQHISQLEVEERNIVANLAVAAMQGAMPFVITSESTRQQAILAHLKRMLTIYLDTLTETG